MNNILFYQDRPVFGLDIGFSSVKLMQVKQRGNELEVSAYATIPFDSSCIKDGIIVKPEALAQEIHSSFAEKLVGKLDTRRVVLSIPAAHAYIRRTALPDLRPDDIAEAVRLEAEEYVPLLPEDTYMDYSIARGTKQETITVSAPKVLVNSYVALAHMLGLEPVTVETTINSGCRLFGATDVNKTPTVLIDLGSASSDITVFDGDIIVTSTVPGGGDSFSESIAQALGITHKEAHLIKTRYGLGVSKKQREITDALTPIIMQIAKEVRRVIRYYDERSGQDKHLDQVITMGGGANMPGLAGYLTNVLRLPVRIYDPWQNVSQDQKLPLPSDSEKSMYATAFGLALVKPEEIFVS
jgi:type IV pilus assembly protein PilM